MNKHQPYDLAQMQSLPLKSKIIMSETRIRDWFKYWDGNVYVSFSGGKDSTVLADLCAKVCEIYGYTLYLVFVNTGLEYPEIQKFVKTFAEWLRNTYNIEVVLDVLRPEMRFDEVIKKYGYPVITKRISNTLYYAKKNITDGKDTIRVKALNNAYDMKNGGKSFFNCAKWKFIIDAPFDVSDHCCAVMKKKPLNEYSKRTNRVPITAQMASESISRKSQWIQHGCNAYEKKHPISNPLSFWTEQDILHYIKEFQIPYCSVYGDIVFDAHIQDVSQEQVNIIDYLGCYEPQDKLTTTGCNRTGCIYCMYGCHLEKGQNRFQRLKETHPRQYEYCINGGEMVDGKWQPSKEGLGIGKVLDFIGVKYE